MRQKKNLSGNPHQFSPYHNTQNVLKLKYHTSRAILNLSIVFNPQGICAEQKVLFLKHFTQIMSLSYFVSSPSRKIYRTPCQDVFAGNDGERAKKSSYHSEAKSRLTYHITKFTAYSEIARFPFFLQATPSVSRIIRKTSSSKGIFVREIVQPNPWPVQYRRKLSRYSSNFS